MNMPKPTETTPQKRRSSTNEAVSFIRGLHAEFSEQLSRYTDLIAHLFELEARIEVVEKNLIVTRDHFALAITNCEERVPSEWTSELARSRFVGVRLADACMALLRERKRMTQDQMVDALNMGQFRFRTNSPAREIHAGLLAHKKNVKRVADGWVWVGEDDTQSVLPLRAVRRPTPPEPRVERINATPK
jgi:hypothetical protein